MKPWLKGIGLTFLGLLGLLMLAVVVVYFGTSGDYSVPATVVHDPELPALEVNGVRLHAESFGDKSKPLVVVLHGGPGDDYRMLLPLQALADEYHLVFYDQRASGLSERVPDDLITLDHFLDDLAGIIKHFAAPDAPVVLLGHSWGAMLASSYIGRHPQSISAAVLAEPGFLTPAQAERFIETVGTSPPVSWQTAKSMLRAWGESMHIEEGDEHVRMDYMMLRLMMTPVPGHPMAGYFCDEDLSTAVLDHWRFGAAASPALFAQAVDDNGKFTIDLSAGVDQFTGPVLFLTSSCNRLIGEEFQKEHLPLFQKATQQVIQGSGHTMFGEQPIKSVAAVRAFLQKSLAPPAAEEPVVVP